jgi:hypothetical protein
MTRTNLPEQHNRLSFFYVYGTKTAQWAHSLFKNCEAAPKVWCSDREAESGLVESDVRILRS